MELWLWSLLLLLLGLVLLVLDLFVPSGGVLATMSALSVVAAIVVGFMSGPLVGLGVLLASAILVPVIVAAAIHVWPHTPIGKQVLIERPQHPDDVLPDNEEYRDLKRLIGARGKAKSLMLPSGVVEIHNRSYDAVSEGMAVDPGQFVQVVAVRTNRLIVRPVDDQLLAASSQPDDLLARPVESLGLDLLEEPPT